MFRGLRLSSWRQFELIELQIHDRVTVITGANATGKTTILNLLSQHFGWSSQFVGVPADRTAAGALRYLVRFQRWRDDVVASDEVIGQITYSDDATTDVVVPIQTESAVYSASFRVPQAVVGLYLTSHRAVAVYQPIGQIPTALPAREQMLESHVNEYRTRYQGGGGSGYTPTYRLKEALLSLAMFGYGSEVLEPNEQARALYDGFQEVLRKVLPASLGFEAIRVRPPEVLLETRTGNFALDAISGGIQAIVDLAWQIFLRSFDAARFVVLIDEPENHLHPELQRTLLTGLLDAFPSAQFIVATHNPFVVTSVVDSHVYALRYNADGRVEAVLLDQANKAGSSNEVLRDVLGVDTPTPLWVERRLDEAVMAFEREPSPERLRAMRDELVALGLGDAFPEAVDRALGDDA